MINVIEILRIMDEAQQQRISFQDADEIASSVVSPSALAIILQMYYARIVQNRCLR